MTTDNRNLTHSAARKNRRRSERLPCSAQITLRWRASEERTHFLRGHVVDYSETGLRIELGAAIPVRTHVILGVPGENRAGWAGWVRDCSPKGVHYVIGLELAPGARWMDLCDSRPSYRA